MSQIRTFIAIRLPGDVLGALAVLADQLASTWPEGSVRWARPEGVHLTLRFLGETDEERVPALASAMSQAADDVPPFALRLAEMGCFPNPRRPRVIWVGIEDADERLTRLQKGMERLARSLGWEKEKRAFSPHLTLGRVRDRALPPEGEWLLQPPPLSFHVDAVELIESRLKPSGAEYVALHRALLGS